MSRSRAVLLLVCVLGGACRERSQQNQPDPGHDNAVAPAPSAAPALPSASATPPEPKLHRPYNVLLIMIDSLRWDMPWAGYPRPIAPRLTELSEKWALYPRAYSLSSYTAKSVVPALVGRYPGEMPHNSRFFTVWPQENVLFSELAQKAGYRTLAGNGHGYFLPGLGVDQGFDDYRLLPGTFLDTTGVHDVNSDKLYRLATEMLSKPENVDQSGQRRFFAYFHFLDPHYTYIKHPGHPDFGSKRRDLYDNEVHFTDEWVGKLIDFVLTAPFGDDTAIIVTADHGEGFGERGHYRHAYEIWESLVRVPLMVRIPGAEPRRVEKPRGHIDLAPTMADLMAIEGGDFRGQSLVPELLGKEVSDRPVLIDLPRADLMDRRRALIDRQYKLISFGDDARFELFDVLADVREERDLTEAEPELFARMKAEYQSLTRSIPNANVIDSGPLKGAPPGQRF